METGRNANTSQRPFLRESFADEPQNRHAGFSPLDPHMSVLGQSSFRSIENHVFFMDS